MTARTSASAAKLLLPAVLAGAFGLAQADENLFGYVKGAETLPQGSWELYEILTQRSDKGTGTYRALDSKTELEYGLTHRLTGSAAFKMMSVDTKGLLINGYLPEDRKTGLRASGVELALKYNFLSAAKDDLGLSTTFEFNYDWLDPHSGQDKTKFEFELGLQLQKYFAEGQVSWVGNAALETTYAKRGKISNLPADFEWSTDPEMEIGLKFGTGISYRFAPKWSIALEALYEAENETEVGLERWSIFAGPTLHYGDKQWWFTATWMPQIRGGGERYDGQRDTDLHLIEKTKQEIRFKVGYNF